MSNDEIRDPRAAPRTNEKEVLTPVPVHQVKDLLGTSREAILVHGRDRYRLRITATNKLIMTK